MIAIALALLLILASVVAALIATSPLFRTLSLVIDAWADSVHGEDAEPIR
jgi:hypothetical protein